MLLSKDLWMKLLDWYKSPRKSESVSIKAADTYSSIAIIQNLIYGSTIWRSRVFRCTTILDNIIYITETQRECWIFKCEPLWSLASLCFRNGRTWRVGWNRVEKSKPNTSTTPQKRSEIKDIRYQDRLWTSDPSALM